MQMEGALNVRTGYQKEIQGIRISAFGAFM
jgi:hypothetical protein